MALYGGSYTPDQLAAMDAADAVSPEFRRYYYYGSLMVVAPLCDHVNQYVRKEDSVESLPRWALIFGPTNWSNKKKLVLDNCNQYVRMSERDRLEPIYKRAYRAFRHLFGGVA